MTISRWEFCSDGFNLDKKWRKISILRVGTLRTIRFLLPLLWPLVYWRSRNALIKVAVFCRVGRFAGFHFDGSEMAKNLSKNAVDNDFIWLFRATDWLSESGMGVNNTRQRNSLFFSLRTYHTHGSSSRRGKQQTVTRQSNSYARRLQTRFFTVVCLISVIPNIVSF